MLRDTFVFVFFVFIFYFFKDTNKLIVAHWAFKISVSLQFFSINVRGGFILQKWAL